MTNVKQFTLSDYTHMELKADSYNFLRLIDLRQKQM